MPRKRPSAPSARSTAPVKALEWVGTVRGRVDMLDQTQLPGKEKTLRIRDLPAMVEAIRRLSVRGAPAIGIAAAYGVVLGARDHAETPARLRRALARADRALRASRPTAMRRAPR